MEINHTTMLVQLDDGRLYYKDGDELELASMTDIQKHYKTMQYNITIADGCWAVENDELIKSLIGEDLFKNHFWQLTYVEMPENIERLK